MKVKTFALCAIAMAVAGCDTESDNNPNTRGSISLSGIAESGQVLTVKVTDPDGIDGLITYIWYADGETIEGEGGDRLALTDEQIGKPITVQALYTDAGGTNESHISGATAEVAAIAYPATIEISGSAFIGETLTANISDQNGTNDAVATYTWFADGQAIDGAVTDTYTLSEAEFGALIKVSASFEDDRGFAEMPESAEVGPVQRTNSEGMVSISGTPTVGNTLEAVVDDADGASGSVNYQWFADDVEIAGATDATYTVESAYVGSVLSVQVTYIDDNGFSEDNTSEPTIAVSNVAVNEPGSIEIIGTVPYLESAALTAVITDNNGVEPSNVVYSWSYGNGVAIDNDTDTLMPTGLAGEIITVTAEYTDNDNFTHQVTDSLSTIIYSQVVSDKSGLVDALVNAPASSVIGLNTNIYTDVDIALADQVQIRGVEGQEPVITGEVCIHIPSASFKAGIQNVTFKDFDTFAGSVCESEEGAVVYVEGEGASFYHNTFDGDVENPNLSTNHWFMVKGNSVLFSRNTFKNRNHIEKGSVIKVSSSAMDAEIEYNLFENSDNPNFDDSSLLLLNLGSTTGADSALPNGATVQYNRIDNFVTGRRLMRVQSSNGVISHNTIINANGGISLEDGGFNEVSNNIIIRTTDIANSNDRPSGILITPLGHTIENNYIAGIRSTNKEAGGIVFTPNPFSQADGGVPNAGNQAVLDGSGDLTLTVSNNTVLNSIQPIVFSTEIGSKAPVGDCDELTAANAPVLYGLTKNFFVINFNANLVANGLNDNDQTQGLFLPFDASSSDHTFEYDCDLINHDESFFSNSFGFSDSYASGDVEDDFWVDIRNINGNGRFDSDGAVDQDPAANGKEAPMLVIAANGLTETDPSGAQAVAGAKGLYLIKAADVGAGSSWEHDDD